MFEGKKIKEPISIKVEAEVNKGVKFKGRTIISPGHRLFEYNLDNGDLSEVMREKQVIVTGDNNTTISKVNTKANCQYFGALNRKNAIRKLKSIGLWKD